MAALESVCLHFTYLPSLRRSVTIGVYEIGASSLFWPMCSVSQLVLIAYLPNFHMVSQMQSYTITWPSGSYLYSFFIFIGSPTPVPAIYTWMTDTEYFGILLSLVDFYLIAFGTYIDIYLPSDLCCALDLGARLVLTLISCSIFYLGAPFIIKTYIQL